MEWRCEFAAGGSSCWGDSSCSRSWSTALPGSRILDGSFLQTGIAIAVPKNRPNALAYATVFMEDAKASGMVRRAFDDAGLKDLVVTPPSAQ